MSKKIQKTLLFIFLGIFIISLMSFIAYKGFFQQTALGISSDGYYYYGDSILSATDMVYKDYCAGVASAQVSPDCRPALANLPDWARNSPLPSNDLNHPQYDIYKTRVWNTKFWNLQGNIATPFTDRSITGNDYSYVKSIKDFYAQNFRVEVKPLPYNYKLSSGKSASDIAPIYIKFGSVSFELNSVDFGSPATVVTGVSSAPSLVLSFEPSALDPHKVKVFFGGMPLNKWNNNNILTLNADSAIFKMWTLQGGFEAKNPRYQLLFSCTIRPNEVWVTDCFDGKKDLGYSINPATFGLSYSPAKACMGLPVDWYSLNQGGARQDYEILEKLFTGEPITIASGDRMCFKYPVDASLNPALGVVCSDSIKIENGVVKGCVGFVNTCTNYNAQTKQCEDTISYANTTVGNNVSSLGEFVDNAVQCQTDSDCVQFAQCPEEAPICDIMTNHCIRQSNCSSQITFTNYTDVISGQLTEEQASQIQILIENKIINGTETKVETVKTFKPSLFSSMEWMFIAFIIMLLAIIIVLVVIVAKKR